MQHLRGQIQKKKTDVDFLDVQPIKTMINVETQVLPYFKVNLENGCCDSYSADSD